MKTSEEPSSKKRKNKRRTKSQSDVLLPDLQPLSYYVSGGDRNVLLEQLFLSVDEETTRSLLLPTLEGKSLEELKEICKAQLAKLSDEEILRMISAVSQHGSDDPQRPDPQDKDDHTRTEHLAQDSGQDVEIKTENESSILPPEGTLQVRADQSEMDTLESVEKESEEPPSSKEVLAEIMEQTSTADPSWTECKTEREIMELEFRARAIRSLMRSQGLVTQDEDDEESAVPRQTRETPSQQGNPVP